MPQGRATASHMHVAGGEGGRGGGRRGANNRIVDKEPVRFQRTPFDSYIHKLAAPENSGVQHHHRPSMEDQPCTVLDPSGDLRLSTATQDFVVSSKAMCLASPVWRAMFDPQGRWAKQSSGVFDLPDDDAHALLLLLRIAHLQFSDLPDALVIYRHLLQLAVLCDK